MKRERRNIVSPLEVRATGGDDSRHIEGYALVFGSRSEDLGGFTEIISKEALDGVLERSDVMALLNHDMSRGVLGRCRNGGGSLKLEVDEKGLRYSFDAPKTALGDEVLEGVRRGDISGSSFAFTVEAEEWEQQGESYLRTIKRFGQLFDISPVYNPAYLDTSVEVDSRGLSSFKQKRAEEEKEKDKGKEDTKPDDEGKEPEDPDKEKDSKGDDEPEGKDSKDDQDSDKEKKDDRENNKDINITHSSMKKEKFSLLRAIRCAAEGNPFDDATNFVIERGREAANSAGVDVRGSILLPLEYDKELRFEDNPNGIIASQTPADKVAGMGGEVVPTDLFDILGPLYDRMILKELGARMLSLNGNVVIPFYSGSEATWESEIAPAKQTGGKFTTLRMAPRRLTAKLPISKQFLIQTSASAEALIRQDLLACIANKLQATIFGDEKGTDIIPQGLFYGVAAETAAFSFNDPVNWEEQLETNKITGEKKYVVSPRTKAIMRTTKIDAGSGLMVMQNNEVLGVPALCSGAVKPKGVILGDWSNFYLASFGALDLIVDPYTLASNAQILLVVNAWFDYLVVRPEAFIKKVLK